MPADRTPQMHVVHQRQVAPGDLLVVGTVQVMDMRGTVHDVGPVMFDRCYGSIESPSQKMIRLTPGEIALVIDVPAPDAPRCLVLSQGRLGWVSPGCGLGPAQ